MQKTCLTEISNTQLLNRYTIKFIDETLFYQLLSNEFLHYFPKELIIKSDDLCKKYQRLNQCDPQFPQVETLYLSIQHDDRPIALFKGFPVSPHIFLMDITVIHPEYRRQGLYSAFLHALLDYTKQAGYSMVISQHSPSNNHILIAKLKAGFYISKMMISPAFGPEVELCYFHNPDLKVAFLYRCGDLVMNKNIAEHSRGTVKVLTELLAGI